MGGGGGIKWRNQEHRPGGVRARRPRNRDEGGREREGEGRERERGGGSFRETGGSERKHRATQIHW